MEEHTAGKKEHFNLAFIIGLICGGCLMFLLGTRRGRELVNELLSEIEQFIDNLQEGGPLIEESGEDGKRNISERLTAAKETIDSFISYAGGREGDHRKNGGRYFRKNGKPLV